MRIDLQADMTKLIVALCNFSTTTKNETLRAVLVRALRGGVKMFISFRSGDEIASNMGAKFRADNNHNHSA